jgi:signal transduction histidine kinase
MSPPSQTQANADPTAEVAGEKPNILLADDEPTQRIALTEALHGLEHRLYVAGDGREALKLLLQRPYAVVLLDVNMPGIDGFEVARMLRERPRSRHTPVIFITAHRADELDLRRGYALGAVDYIFAPVSPGTLRAKVSVFLELERMRRELEREIAEGRRAAAEIVSLNAGLRRRAAELEAANAELDAFTGVVSHDLRAPLRAIEGYARMVEEDYFERLDGEARRLLKVVRDECRKMERLIENLLSFTRCSRAPLQPALIDMAELARTAFIELRNGDAARAPSLRVAQLPAGRGDPDLIRQVWMHLLSNAIKYCARQPQSTVEIDGQVEGGESVYCVRDNGAGFDMRYYDRLFGLFQRPPGGERAGGAGVGLAIVERVVTRHGGRVWAEGKPNEGAAFYFSLPADLRVRGA